MAIKKTDAGGYAVDWPQVMGMLGTVAVLIGVIFWVGDRQWFTQVQAKPIKEHLITSAATQRLMDAKLEQIAANAKNDVQEVRKRQSRSWSRIRQLNDSVQSIKNEQIKQGAKQDAMLGILKDLKSRAK